MRILILLILIAIYATADEPISPLSVTNAVLNISATPVLNDAKHKDSIAAILTVVGLSSPDLVLRVTDSKGTVTELEHAQILEQNTKGVVTLIDDLIVFDIPLSKVSHISVRERTGIQDKHHVTVTLKSGEKRTGWMNMAPVTFVGQTAVGQAQIRMYDVREVENVTRR